MYAVVKTGGKQYRVEEGDVLAIEKLDAGVGDTVTMGDVLLVGEGDKVTLGAPTVSGAKVTAEVVDQFREKKIVIFKKRRRQNSRRKAGHRQNKTSVKITKISA